MHVICYESSNIKLNIFADLLFIQEDIILELPSFTKSSCRVTDYPEGNVDWAQSGLVSSKLVACSLSGCYCLQNGTWTVTTQMITNRKEAGSSNFDGGWLVTGGATSAYSIFSSVISSTEVLDSGNWTSNISLPQGIYRHCQLTIGNNIIITGDGESILLPLLHLS